MKALVCDWNYLGDVLMSSPTYRALKDFGYSHVDSVGYDFVREALEANPYIDNIYTTGTGYSKFKAMSEACMRRYDFVLQLNTSFKTNLLMSLTGAPTLGYSYGWRGLPLTYRYDLPHRTCTVGNRRDEVLALLERHFNKVITERDMIFVPERRTTVDPDLIAIHVNTKNTRDLRRWHRVGWNALVRELGDHRIVFTGTEEDREYIDHVRLPHCPNYGGAGTLQQFATFLTGCKLFITVNTGALHLALALGVPTVALIGGTPASVCVGPETDTFKYIEAPDMDMTKITPEMVMEKVRLLL